jgi:hypothetical protein
MKANLARGTSGTKAMTRSASRTRRLKVLRKTIAALRKVGAWEA